MNGPTKTDDGCMTMVWLAIIGIVVLVLWSRVTDLEKRVDELSRPPATARAGP